MTQHKFTAISVTFLALLLAAPASAGVTAAQRRDIERLYDVFGQCAPGAVDPGPRQACALSVKLQRKLGAQGFCFYKRLEVGRPSRDGKSCVPLHD